MTGDKSLFKNLKEKEDGFVTFGDGSHSQVLGKGTVDIPGLPLLTDVMYIKGLKVNLLSITQICDEDLLVQFSKKGCLILNEEGVQLLKGLRTNDNCYGVIPKPSIACRSAQVNLLELWHQRLGHANYKQVAKVSKFEAMVGLPKFGKVEKNVCGPCQLGKQTKSSHPKVNVIATSRPLELLHVDLLEMCPWSFEKQLIFLKEFEGELAPRDIVMKHCPFWVQIFNLPLKSRTKETGWAIESSLREVLDVDVSDLGVHWGRCLRVYVSVDITKKLICGKKINIEGGENRWVIFKYERLPNFCYKCGMLDYAIKKCSEGPLVKEGEEEGS